MMPLLRDSIGWKKNAEASKRGALGASWTEPPIYFLGAG